MKKVYAIFFAVLILLANTGITLSTHYCGGMAVHKSFMIGEGTLGCSMNGMEDNCNNPMAGQSQLEDDCCNDAFASVKIHDSIIHNEITENFNNQFVLTFPVTITHDFSPVSDGYYAFTAYSPPDANTDLAVLYRNLRI